MRASTTVIPARFHLAAALAMTSVLMAACGGGGGDGSPAPDTTAPTVSVGSLAGDLSRTVTLTATATDNVGVTQVEFFVDDASVGSDSSSPYSVAWDSGAVSDGSHTVKAVARDAAGNVATSTSVTVSVGNVHAYPVALSSAQQFPVNLSSGAATGSLTVNLATGAISGDIMVAGFDATAAHIHDGFAGVNGSIVIGLEQDGANPAHWQVPAGASLAAGAVDRLLAGALYVNAHSAAHPSGEVRGQILPSGFDLLFSDLAGGEEIPAVVSSYRGRAAVTVDTTTRTVNIHVNTTDANGVPTALPGASGAHLHLGVAGLNGSVLVGLAQDAALASHWFVDSASLAQSAFDALMAAGTYVNVHSTSHSAGEIRGQVVPSGYTVVVSPMNGEQETPEPRITSARGSAAVTVNDATGAADIILNVTDANDATAAHVHDGFAGTSGPSIISLEKDATEPTRWRSNGATLTAPQMGLLASGGLYANVHTPAATAGLVRGQLLPRGIDLVLSHLNGAQEAPAPVATAATGRASTTVDTIAGRLTIHVNTIGVVGTAAHIHRGARGVAGSVSIGLLQDGGSPAHWFASDVALSPTQLADYLAGQFYVNVHSAANTGGEIRGQIELAGVRPLQYADIQSIVFDSTCATSGCHSGAGAPHGLDLDSGVSHGNLVDVPSQEVPALLRVAPGDAPASYLVRKLEGGPDIVGVRMPNGLPPLAPATINGIRAWINAGALPAPAPPLDTVPPTVSLGAVAGTLTGTVSLTATASDDTGVTLVRWRVNGNVVGSDTTAPYSMDWNSATVADGAVTLDAQALDAAGNVGTSAAANSMVSNPAGPVPFTFNEIQAQIFNQSCAFSGCHAGSSPAGGMNLSAPAYSQIVNVASTEKPGLMRVNPGNASQSYIIHKLEGGPSIVGARMPFGGPYLDQATIDRIRAWIDSGAPNN